MQPMSLVAGTLVPALLQKSHVGPVLRQSSSKGNPEGERLELPSCGSCGHHRSGGCRRSDRNETTVRLSVGLQANRLAAPQPTVHGTFSKGDAVVVPVTPAAMPCRNHSHRETIKSLVDVCREHSDRHCQRGPS
ncbi:hypothetical protein Tc00.1047053506877.50 [Trypanosoma cruzi]|uniref:Uncharacterized protein n=1 Tax=Trypanosoma cruzi (strain CL Brener) TaxID=353153 RepID=Q4CVH6_TRYCC|nr:hypothetical protein Tc00.1047053506877.50 [Trypanosoma cruzi]EAN84279.1 hypothetical protein Tc00.1047053506877.50 [Trypanosoma cruzi]|eukprot:XP_806130.1 hypothetical protein [Trypanosoma cruzi strain CL Brener]